MLIKQIVPLVFFVLLCSCGSKVITQEDDVDFLISSPKAGWTYYDDTKLMLAVNVNTNDVSWSSSLSGHLGNGNHLTLFLPYGMHRISAMINGQLREQNVYVSQSTAAAKTILVNYAPLEIKTKIGNCYSYLYSHNGSIEDFKIATIDATTASVQAAWHQPNRDIRLHTPQAGKPYIQIHPKGRSLTGNVYTVGDKRSFFVINTENQTGTPHAIEAELTYQSELLSVWVSETISGAVLDECMQTVETLVIPRVTALWGQAADINGDGRIALLFSATLNVEKKAFGFFNPADFYQRNEDVTQESYNPYSNEMDIIYAALPDNSSGSPYTSANITATIAHEMAHAATFTAKTWNRARNGNANAQREELFLEEGWSHLTENLCGLGISGGNIEYKKRFLQDTSAYSFCGPNQEGLDDSPGMRGAITLFLSWLFWEAGGMSWDSTNPVKLIDHGGISFLQRMVQSPQTGWESIGAAFGQPISQLFNGFLNAMHNARVANAVYNYKTDPVTGEAVDFFVNMGGDIGLGFPKSTSLSNPTSLLPWSFVFLDPFIISDDSLVVLDFAKVSGSVFYCLQGKGLNQ